MKIESLRISWKALFALALIVGVSYWAVNSILPHSYSATNLNFGVGSGTVTITNPSLELIPAQLVSQHPFRTSSAVESLSGSSVRQGSGSGASYVLDFGLQPGKSEFSLARGTDVKFVAVTETILEATAFPLTTGSSRTTIGVAVIVILGSLFYISNSMEHRWITILRRQETAVSDYTPLAEPADAQSDKYRPYGDNRVKRK